MVIRLIGLLGGFTLAMLGTIYMFEVEVWLGFAIICVGIYGMLRSIPN